MTPAGSHRWATARYTIVWLLAGATLAALVALVVPSDSEVPPEGPVGLERAARDAECMLRRDAGSSDPATVDVMQPPTFGPPGATAEPGVYTRSPSSQELVGALRRGVVVVQYKPRLRDAQVDDVRERFEDVMSETIVTPDDTGMRYAVAVTAWSRLLGCPRVASDVLDVAGEFHAEYVGTGPEANP